MHCRMSSQARVLMGVFRGGGGFALFKYSLSSFLPNHMYTVQFV